MTTLTDLPAVGRDRNAWGEKLNAALEVRNPVQNRAAVSLANKLTGASPKGAVLTLGDSKMEGSGIGSGPSTDRSQNRMIDAVRIGAGMAGAGWDMGRGYIPAKYGTFYTMSDAPTYINTADVMNEGGLGSRSISVEKPGSQAGVINFGNLDFGTATSFQVAYTRRPDTANVQVLIDDVVASTINTNNPSLVYGGLATVAITPGVRNIKIRQTGDYVARIEGIVHRTANKGITLYDGCRAGAQSTFYTPGSTQPDRVWQSMSTVCQDVGVIVCALGANDMASIPLSAWENNLRAIVTKGLQVFPAAGFVFLMAAERLEDVNIAGSTKHADFTARARRVMAEFDHTTFLEEASFWQPRPGSTQAEHDPQGWLADTVHYGAGAGRVLGRALAASILGG